MLAYLLFSVTVVVGIWFMIVRRKRKAQASTAN